MAKRPMVTNAVFARLSMARPERNACRRRSWSNIGVDHGTTRPWSREKSPPPQFSITAKSCAGDSRSRYTRAKYGFDADTCAVISSLKRQSPDIAMAWNTGGAGDQGLMFGYACDETDDSCPAHCARA